MVMLPIERGKKGAEAIRACCYGPEGVGKSTFASMWPDPVFLDLEDGTTHYDVARLPKPRNFRMLIQVIEDVAEHPDELKTLVIDTADAAEAYMADSVCEEHQVSNHEDIGYGRGYSYLASKFSEFLAALDKVKDAGVNVLVLAHSQIKKFEQPDELGAYDRYELKLSKKCNPLLKEWCDLLLFANFKTDVMTDDNGKAKATGGTKRFMYTQHRAAYDAKNRFGLPEKLPFEFSQIATHVKGADVGHDVLQKNGGDDLMKRAREADAKLVDIKSNLLDGAVITDVTPENVRKLHKLMERDGVNEATLAAAVAARPKTRYTEFDRISDYSDKFIDSLVEHWDSVAASAKELAPYAQDEIPF